jgi:putative oxidoreductase
MFTSKFENQIYGAMRIIVGFLFLWHGTQKYFSYPPAGGEIPFYLIAIGGSVELFGGILVMVGLFTRYAAFIASGEMAYAYWSSHGPHAVLPLVNHGELAVLYCFVFLFISAKGAGIFSIDSLIGMRHKKPEKIVS